MVCENQQKITSCFSKFWEPALWEPIWFFYKYVDTLAWHRNFRIFLGGELDPFVNYFVKIKLNEYHKIMIPAQH